MKKVKKCEDVIQNLRRNTEIAVIYGDIFWFMSYSSLHVETLADTFVSATPFTNVLVQHRITHFLGHLPNNRLGSMCNRLEMVTFGILTVNQMAP